LCIAQLSLPGNIENIDVERVRYFARFFAATNSRQNRLRVDDRSAINLLRLGCKAQQWFSAVKRRWADRALAQPSTVLPLPWDF
jgi:hypothetical protein